MSNGEAIALAWFILSAISSLTIMVLSHKLQAARKAVRVANEQVFRVGQIVLACDMGEKLNLVHFRRVMELEARYKGMFLCIQELRAATNQKDEEIKEYKDRLDLICNARRIGKPRIIGFDRSRVEE
ncbi:hypothetical protein A9Q81_11765 [Gammaproteobacteria bacterium 42_54_T18]|nr:hypothetical protein A9Q81_11765 [Gammaproteobacteria bacterium 42_54_T18]